MKTSAALLVSTPVLWILAMNAPLPGDDDSGFLMLASYLTFAAGIYWGFSRGTAAARKAVVLSAVSLALFYIAMVLAPTESLVILAEPPLIALPRLDPIVATAATVFLSLAVLQWIRAFSAERRPI